MKPICHLDNSLRVKLSAAAKACIGFFYWANSFYAKLQLTGKKTEPSISSSTLPKQNYHSGGTGSTIGFFTPYYTPPHPIVFLKQIHKKLQGSLTVAVTAGFHVMIASLHTKLCTFTEVSARCKWSLAFWQFYHEKSYPPGVKGKPLQRTPNLKSF